MKTLLRWLTGLFLVLATALFVLTLNAPTLLPPGEQKALLSTLVEGRSGRKLTIDGNIRLRITPGLHLFCSLNKASLSGNPAFGDTPFVSSEQTNLELVLWPLLLQRRLQINSITMDNVAINLIRSKNNIGNWEQGAALPAQQPAAAAESVEAAPPPLPAPATAPASRAIIKRLKPLLQTLFAVQKFNIGRFSLNGVNLRHENRLSGDIQLVNNLWIMVGAIKDSLPFPFEAGGNFYQENVLGQTPAIRALDLSVSGNGTLSNGGSPTLLLEDVRAEGTIKAGILQKRGLRFNSTASIKIQPEEEQITIKEFTLRQNEITAKGSGLIKNLDKPQGNLALTITESDPQPLLKQLKNPPSLSPHASALQKFSAALQIEAGPESISINPLTLALDDSTLTGVIVLPRNKEESATANLHIDQINLERYQHLAGIIPLRQCKLRPLQLDLDIDTLTTHNIELSQAHLHLTGNNGIFAIAPFSANIEKGNIETSGQIDLSGNIPKLLINKTVNKIPINPYLAATTGREDLSGTATLHIHVTTSGKNTQELWRQMNGSMDFTLLNGEIKNPLLIKTMQQCGSSPDATPGSVTQESIPEKLPFARLSGSGVLTNGILTTSDLLAATPAGQTKGSGELDFNSGFIKLTLNFQPGNGPFPATQVAAGIIPATEARICNISGNLNGTVAVEALPPTAPAATDETPAAQEEVAPEEVVPQQLPPQEPVDEQLPEPVEKVTGD